MSCNRSEQVNLLLYTSRVLLDHWLYSLPIGWKCLYGTWSITWDQTSQHSQWWIPASSETLTVNEACSQRCLHGWSLHLITHTCGCDRIFYLSGGMFGPDHSSGRVLYSVTGWVKYSTIILNFQLNHLCCGIKSFPWKLKTFPSFHPVSYNHYI